MVSVVLPDVANVLLGQEGHWMLFSPPVGTMPVLNGVAHVLATGHDLEIVQPVVGLVAILVVDLEPSPVPLARKVS
jgi:hypothetical protein